MNELMLFVNRVAAKRTALVTRGCWAIADQGVVSMGTFFTNIVLARHLSPDGYGAYSVVFGIVLFLNGIHGSLITYPLSVKGAVSGGLSQTSGVPPILTLALGIPLAAGLLAGVASALTASLALWFAALLLLWQLQETLRRTLMSRLRHRDALWGDMLSYLGQAALIWVLCRRGRISLEEALGVMALTSLTAAVLQAAQVGIKFPKLHEVLGLGLVFWKLGSWMLVGNALNIVSIQSLFWILASCHGARAVASFQAVANVLGFVHPLLFSIGNLLVPAVARAYSDSGFRTALECVVRYGSQMGVLLLPYFAIAIWRPRTLLLIFYGPASPYLELSSAVRLFAVAYGLIYITQVLTALLGGLESAKAVLAVQLLGAVASIIVGLPLAAGYGLAGACVALVAVSAVKAGTGVYCVIHERKARTYEQLQSISVESQVALS